MNILFITPWYPHEKNPNSGVFIRDQAEIVSENHQVIVFFSNIDYEKVSLFKYNYIESEHHGIKEYRLMMNASVFFLNHLFFYIISIVRLIKIVRRFKPELIHAHVSYPSAFFAWITSRWCKVPSILVEHTRITNHFRNSFLKHLTIFSLKRMSKCFAVGSTLRDEMRDSIGRSVDILPNVVDVERFKNVSKTDSAVPQFGFLGALNTPVKGLDILLNSLAEIQSDFVCHIGGHGILLQAYKEQAQSLKIFHKCKFYGFVAHSDIPLFLSRLNFFVSSSRYETFGIVIVEALASGLPVVVTRCGGPVDFVSDENGIIVEAENKNDLAKGIELMLANYSQYNPNLIVKSTDRFSRESFAVKIEEIYNAIRNDFLN